ncbi:hypothetical protein G7039_09085 [Rhizobium leguminosarum]|uniref:hypothetical protein n=1 Tax=Rhizobium ruizarguesonis TaxID=2081791 RepID=UPI0013E07DF9|nr:hypothetical protein [Rhizobium ruizarguesonis]NEJ95261.1 hypothetical protein [Rhizobium ruizarguesonis]QIJ40271.1 hypothetical protein G7039_09085 [Rhizobium leguminosarum]
MMTFHENLPSLINRAASQLANAVSAAEVLEARHAASLAYDAAKKAARFAKAKGAHDQLIAAAHRAQADALEIEATAKRRLADEYDAAQERGEVAGPSDGDHRRSDRERLPTAADIGLSRKDVHEARQIRDAEKADPGVIRRTLDEKIDSGEEPTKAALRKAVVEVAKQGLSGRPASSSNKNPLYRTPTKAGAAWTHLYGTCRALSEWASQGENVALALCGIAERTDDQAANIAAVRKCAATLNRFLEDL